MWSQYTAVARASVIVRRKKKGAPVEPGAPYVVRELRDAYFFLVVAL